MHLFGSLRILESLPMHISLSNQVRPLFLKRCIVTMMAYGSEKYSRSSGTSEGVMVSRSTSELISSSDSHERVILTSQTRWKSSNSIRYHNSMHSHSPLTLTTTESQHEATPTKFPIISYKTGSKHSKNSESEYSSNGQKKLSGKKCKS